MQTFKHRLKTHLFIVLQTILKHDPTFHLVTARASHSVIYSNSMRVISLRIIIIIIIIIILLLVIAAAAADDDDNGWC